MEGKPWPRNSVYRIEAGVWMVPSRRHTRGAYWLVTWHRQGARHYYHCTCPRGRETGDMTTGNLCAHVLAAARAEMDDGYSPRPPGTVNPSTFVD